MNVAINANLEKINSQLNSIDQKHDCLENDISKVTTAIKEMELVQKVMQGICEDLVSVLNFVNLLLTQMRQLDRQEGLNS